MLALDPAVPMVPSELPPIILLAWKQSGLPWCLKGGGGGNEDSGGDNAEDAIDAAGSTYSNIW